MFKKYSPYCSECDSCGEVGCCSPIGCNNHPNGKYCKTNLDELRVNYLTLGEFWELLSTKNNDKDREIYDKLLEELNIIYGKHSDYYYDKRMAEPEKLFWYECVLNWFKLWI